MRLPGEHPIATFREWAKIITPFLALIAASAAAVGAWNNFRVAEARQKIDQRPWVSLDTFAVNDITYDTSGLSWSLQFQIKNSGLTPAQRVAVAVEPFLTFTPFVPEKVRDKACADAEASGAALSIFPRDQFPWGIGASIKTGPIEEVRTHMKSVPTAGLTPWNVVCVAYRSTLDEKFHHTPYNVMVEIDGLTVSTENTPPKKLTGSARGLPFDRIGSVD